MTLFKAALLLFFVLDPFGNIPFFIAALEPVDSRCHVRVILRELAIALVVLLVFFVSGKQILSSLQISDPALGLAGGTILFLIALRMIFPPTGGPGGEAAREEPFIVPLAVPYVAGPSAVATVMSIRSREPARWREWLLALLAAWLAAGSILIFSGYFSRILGRKILKALERLMGMLLVAIAVQMLLNGVAQYIDSLAAPWEGPAVATAERSSGIMRRLPFQSNGSTIQHMLPNSLRTRGVVFAILFGPPRFVRREEAAAVHGRVCDKLGYDDIAFQYGTSSPDLKPSSKGFGIRFERKDGRGVFQAVIEYPGASQPMKLLVSHDWPPSLEHVKELFDLTAKAVFEALEGESQRVLAEVRLRAQCDVREKSGLEFVLQRMLRVTPEQLSGLGGPLAFASVKMEIAGGGSPVNSLDNPRRDLTVEVLREDPRCIYLELVSQWSQIPSAGGQPGALDLSRIRPIDQAASAYIDEAHGFLTAKALSLGA